MGEIKIQTVCGFGVGSSLFLRIKMEKILEENGIEARVFCGDVGTCTSTPCDAIFISEELSERVVDRSKVPVIKIKSFTDDEELREKLLDFFKQKDENN